VRSGFGARAFGMSARCGASPPSFSSALRALAPSTIWPDVSVLRPQVTSDASVLVFDPPGVLSLSDCFEVLRVDATLEATTAAPDVIDLGASRNRSYKQLVGEPMRSDLPPVDAEQSVALSVRVPSPHPTLVRAAPVDEVPETCLDIPPGANLARQLQRVTVSFPPLVVHPAPTTRFVASVASINAAHALGHGDRAYPTRLYPLTNIGAAIVKAEHAAYGRAQAKVAKTQAAYEAALADLETASQPLGDEIARAWDINQRAVTLADGAVTAAMENLARVQAEASTAARARIRQAAGRGHPVLTEDEVALVEAAEGLLAEAKQTHADAQDRFKAGVTAEQLDQLGG
jgi:hypothetical protein